MSLFGNNQQNQNQNTPPVILNMIENARNTGKINDAQYNELMKNKNNPQGMLSVLLNNGLNTNAQVEQAWKQYANSFFGIK